MCNKYLKLNNKNVLVTGGLGFIGSNLCIKLLEFGANVTILDNMLDDSGANKFNISSVADKVKLVIGDIGDEYVLEKCIANQEYIFNLAGTLSHIDSMTNPILDLEVNSLGQLKLLEVCRKINPRAKIVFTGSRCQYGQAKHVPADESCPMEPTDVNGINKISGEAFHMLYNKVYNMDTCSLRLTNTYGPRHQMKHHRQGVLNWFIKQAIDGNEIKIYGTGEQLRDINYVDDVVEALILAMLSDNTTGNVYNIGGEAISLVQFVEMLIKVNDKGTYFIESFPDDYKNIEIGDYIANYNKFSRDTGWSPKMLLKDGLVETVNYYKINKKHYR